MNILNNVEKIIYDLENANVIERRYINTTNELKEIKEFTNALRNNTKLHKERANAIERRYINTTEDQKHLKK